MIPMSRHAMRWFTIRLPTSDCLARNHLVGSHLEVCSRADFISSIASLVADMKA